MAVAKKEAAPAKKPAAKKEEPAKFNGKARVYHISQHENGYKVNSDALSVLAERLNENRLETRQELEKLMTYLGNNKQVTLKDVLEVVTDTQNSSSDLFCMAVAGGDRERADKEYHLLLENGENPVSIVRILFIYFNKLLDGISVISILFSILKS